MLKVVKIVLERNTKISACCCQEALAHAYLPTDQIRRSRGRIRDISSQ